MLQDIINYAKEIQALFEEGKSLKEISQYSFQQRENGRNIPYLAVLNKEGDKITDLSASPISSQRELKAFFNQCAPDSTLSKYNFYVNHINGVEFTEKLGKGKDNKISLI